MSLATAGRCTEYSTCVVVVDDLVVAVHTDLVPEDGVLVLVAVVVVAVAAAAADRSLASYCAMFRRSVVRRWNYYYCFGPIRRLCSY